MESTKNPYLKSHIAIIKSLLDGSKKTQNQIAKETEYEKSTISHALDYLEREHIIIREPIKKESGYTNKGNYNNKLCWLTYGVDNGKYVLIFLGDMLKKYPPLISDLHKSDKIRSMLSEKYMFYCMYQAGLPQVETSDKGMLVPKTEIDKAKEDFKEKLILSPTFFEKFLNDSDNLFNKYSLIFAVFMGKDMDNFSLNKWMGLALDRFFIACVLSDLLKNPDNTDGVGYIQEKYKIKIY